jgi:hypothetical protein
MGHRSKGFARIVGALGVAALAASAWAQDYTVTPATSQLETRPASATQLPIASNSGPESIRNYPLQLPFSFPYYGTATQNITISGGGFIVPRWVTALTGQMANSLGHGQDATSGAFPYTQSGGGVIGDQNFDGLIAPLWGGTQINAASFSTGFVYTWTTGTAPTRHVVVSWENASTGTTSTTPITFQVHLYEGTGRIVFAYTTTGAYPTSLSGGYVCGLDSPIDARFTAPLTTGRTNYGYPGADFVFDPRVATYTGTVLYDRIVSDATGIGNSVQSNQPLVGCEVELRVADGTRYAVTTAATNGTFSIPTIGGPVPPSVGIVAQNAACSVSPSGYGAPVTWVIGSSPFGAGTTLGTRTLSVAGDSSGDIRAALNIARVCGRVYAWATPSTTKTIPRLGVSLDPASSTPTKYQAAAAPGTPYLFVASRSASNPDTGDEAVVAKAYGRHVLASIAGPPTTNYDDRFDAVTDDQNAFAEGFGYYLYAAAFGSSSAVDAKTASTATVVDLESPTITVPRGSNVAGCDAAALYDLIDPANESLDLVDGSLTADRALRAAASLSVAPNVGTFLQAWYDAGYDAVGVTRTFIGNGALADDALELNDSAAEAAPVVVGGAPKTLVLNRYNEDWFSTTLSADAPSFAADAKYDPVTTGATVAVEIRDAGGALLATGTLIPATGAVHATTGAVVAGTYKVRVRHVSGGTVPAYSFQAYVPPSMDAAPVHDWTVGRPYDIALGVRDGIAPYTLSTPSSSMPPGMGLNSATLHATGTPSTVGSYSLTVQLKDSGDPANVAIRTQTVTVHDVFTLPIAPFVGFPAGKTIDATLPTHEGTPPFTLTMSSGALTSGLSFAPNTLHVTGTAMPGPSGAFELDGVDVAGSADHVATRAVVAVELTGKKIPANLAAGVDACGWWFDAVEGSTVTFAVATAKGQPKRALTGAFLAPDRSLVTTGKMVGKLGAVSASRLVCPTSGRYYFVASSDDVAGLATQLVGTATVALPKAGHGLNKTFAPNASTTIELGAVPGSTATVKFAGDKKATLVAKVVSVTDPNGVPVPGVTLATLVKSTPTGGVLTLPLPVGGTWTVVLGATSTTNAPGNLTYSYAIQQIKGAVYSAE